MRRALLRGLLAVAGGLPPRRPDQYRPDSSAGVAPGPTAGALRARLVIISGPSSGMFLYSPGAPRHGNLVESVTEAAFDPFTNTTQPGFASYDNVFGGVAQLHGALLKLFSGGNMLAQLGPAGLSVLNSSGALIFSVDTARDAWFLYANTGSAAQGALIASSASAAGTDSFGNTVPPGLTSYAAVAGTFPGTYAITLADQQDIYGNTVASLLFNNLTHSPNVPPGVTAQTHNTIGSNLNLQSGRTVAGSAPAEVQVQDSTSSGQAGGLVDVLAGALQVTLPGADTYRTERFTQALATDFAIAGGQTAFFTFNVSNVNGGTWRVRGLVRGVMGGTASTVGYQFGGTATISGLFIGGILSAGGTFPGTTESEFNFITATGTDFPSPTFTAGFSYQFWFEGLITVSAAGTFTISDRAVGFAHTIKALSFVEVMPV